MSPSRFVNELRHRRSALCDTYFVGKLCPEATIGWLALLRRSDLISNVYGGAGVVIEKRFLKITNAPSRRHCEEPRFWWVFCY